MDMNKKELENTKELITKLKLDIDKNNEEKNELLENRKNLINEYNTERDQNAIETEF